MNEAQRTADQMRRAMAGEAWHGPALLELLEGVEAEQAARHPIANAHSIWEIVLHVAAWKSAVLRRLRGEVIELTGEQDWPPVKDTSERAWIATLEQLKRAHNELERTAAGLEDSRLRSSVPGKDYDVYFMLHGVVQHDLYHAGQIALLKKAQSLRAPGELGIG